MDKKTFDLTPRAESTDRILRAHHRARIIAPIVGNSARTLAEGALGADNADHRFDRLTADGVAIYSK